MSEHDWLEPLDRRIEQVRKETEAIKKKLPLWPLLIAFTSKMPMA